MRGGGEEKSISDPGRTMKWAKISPHSRVEGDKRSLGFQVEEAAKTFFSIGLGETCVVHLHLAFSHSFSLI